MSRLGKAWRLWAKALGTKEGNTDLEANLVAIIRTILFLAGLVFSLWGAYGKRAGKPGALAPG